jgi:hypothetical protein
MNIQAGALAAYDAVEWVQLLGLGGLAGALGQGARTIVGLKKLSDAASAANVETSELIVASKIFVSLAIGFVAGALAAIGLVDNLKDIPGEQIFALVAAGYGGTDIIEGLISRVPGTSQAAPGQEAVGVPGNAATTSSDDAVG